MSLFRTLVLVLFFSMAVSTIAVEATIPDKCSIIEPFLRAIQSIEKNNYVVFDTRKPICMISKQTIIALVDELRDPNTNPFKRIFIFQNLFGLPIFPPKNIVNWNERQYQDMRRQHGPASMTPAADFEARTVIILHEKAEADAATLYGDDADTTGGEIFSGFISFMIDEAIPTDLNYLIGQKIRKHFLPNCSAKGVPSIGLLLKTSVLDEMIGDKIDTIFGESRKLTLVFCGVNCAHTDPFVIITESNLVFGCKTQAAKALCKDMRNESGELQALKAAGLDYGNELRDPRDINLRRAIYREYGLGGTVIRNLN